MLTKFAIFTGSIILICVLCVTSKGNVVLRSDVNSAMEALPPKVVHLITYWPDPNVLASERHVKGDEDSYISMAKNRSVSWIKKVLSPGWLPTEKEYLKNNLIMIRNEFGKFDVTHVEWGKKGYKVQISQMAGIITIKLTPLFQQKIEETTYDKVKFAKDLCGKIVNDSGHRFALRVEDNNGRIIKKTVKIPVHGLSQKICSYSFQNGLVHEFSDGIIGIPVSKNKDDLRQKNRNRNEIDDENIEDNPDWHKSASSWGYWWRHVSWFHDKESISFFILKTEGGAWNANYWDNFGKRWFEGPLQPKKR